VHQLDNKVLDLTDNLQTHATCPVHIFLVNLVSFKQMLPKTVDLGNLYRLTEG